MGLLFALLFGLLVMLPAVLVVIGGLVSLVVVVDKCASKTAPVTFAAFFAGLGYWTVLIVSGVFVSALVMKGFTVAVLVPLLFGGIGGIGGGVYGYRLGVARKRRYAYLDV